MCLIKNYGSYSKCDLVDECYNLDNKKKELEKKIEYLECKLEYQTEYIKEIQIEGKAYLF